MIGKRINSPPEGIAVLNRILGRLKIDSGGLRHIRRPPFSEAVFLPLTLGDRVSKTAAATAVSEHAVTHVIVGIAFVKAARQWTSRVAENHGHYTLGGRGEIVFKGWHK